MTLLDGMRFQISGEKVFVQTPQDGIDVHDFLQIMRRSLDTWRSLRNKKAISCLPEKTPTPPDSCAFPKVDLEGCST